jgi:hypothetical protein
LCKKRVRDDQCQISDLTLTNDQPEAVYVFTVLAD